MTAQADKFSSARAQPAPLTRTAAFPFAVETHADLSSIEALWRRFESTGISTIFQRYDWVDAYVRHVLPHEKARPAMNNAESHPRTTNAPAREAHGAT